jgi:hypothetical protein
MMKRDFYSYLIYNLYLYVYTRKIEENSTGKSEMILICIYNHMQQGMVSSIKVNR